MRAGDDQILAKIAFFVEQLDELGGQRFDTIARIVTGEHGRRRAGKQAVRLRAGREARKVAPKRGADRLGQRPSFGGRQIVEMQAGIGRTGRGGGRAR